MSIEHAALKIEKRELPFLNFSNFVDLLEMKYRNGKIVFHGNDVTNTPCEVQAVVDTLSPSVLT